MKLQIQKMREFMEELLKKLQNSKKASRDKVRWYDKRIKSLEPMVHNDPREVFKINLAQAKSWRNYYVREASAIQKVIRGLFREDYNKYFLFDTTNV